MLDISRQVLLGDLRIARELVVQNRLDNRSAHRQDLTGGDLHLFAQQFEQLTATNRIGQESIQFSFAFLPRH
ncbi:MAG TPA: hypothetical protein VHZ24_06400 [Pirellulales bacterium]|nr:hypothetical protein [Pirellulales bacterium]